MINSTSSIIVHTSELIFPSRTKPLTEDKILEIESMLSYGDRDNKDKRKGRFRWGVGAARTSKKVNHYIFEHSMETEERALKHDVRKAVLSHIHKN